MSMLNHFFNYKPEVLALDEKAMELCQPTSAIWRRSAILTSSKC